jgi:anti-sigma factor RsiW
VRSPAESELNCADLTTTLERRWDGELSSAEAVALDQHLAACADCARKASVFDHLRKALHSIDGSARALPSGAEWTRRVAAQERGFRQGRRVMGLGGLSLAGATVAFVFFFRGALPQERATLVRPTKVTQSAAAPIPQPALLVIDDEEGGRQVFQSASRTE